MTPDPRRYRGNELPNLGDEVRSVFANRIGQIDGQAYLVNSVSIHGIGLNDGTAFIYCAGGYDLVSRLADRPLSRCPVLFLDIDGVLNGHEKYATGYSGIHRDRVEVFNTIIERVPDMKLVISSAWRYQILSGEMTVKGFETLLLVHGLLVHGRLAGHTEADGPLDKEPSHFDTETWNRVGLEMRAKQILKFVEERKLTRWAAVDDLDIGLTDHFHRTNGNVGMTAKDANALVEMLT